jgi:hypothetical protein
MARGSCACAGLDLCLYPQSYLDIHFNSGQCGCRSDLCIIVAALQLCTVLSRRSGIVAALSHSGVACTRRGDIMAELARGAGGGELACGEGWVKASVTGLQQLMIHMTEIWMADEGNVTALLGGCREHLASCGGYSTRPLVIVRRLCRARVPSFFGSNGQRG